VRGAARAISLTNFHPACLVSYGERKCEKFKICVSYGMPPYLSFLDMFVFETFVIESFSSFFSFNQSDAQ